MIAFLTHVEELAGEPARWLHLGMTSSDVLDTALAIQTGRALEQILDAIGKLEAALARRAREHARTPMIGRSHGIHAEPITAGLTFARWYAEVARAAERITRAAHAIAVGKIAGAVGVYGNLDPQIEAEALDELGLTGETVATQIVARDRHAEVCARSPCSAPRSSRSRSACGTGSAPRSARPRRGSGAGQRAARRCAQEEPDPQREPVRPRAALRRPGPASRTSRCGTSATSRTRASSASRCPTRRSSPTSTARATSPSGPHDLPEPDAPPQAPAAAPPGVPSRVRWAARQPAYEMVQRSALTAIQEAAAVGQVGAQPGRFRALLGADPDVASRLDPAALDALFDLEHHLRHAPTIIDRALGDREPGKA